MLLYCTQTKRPATRAAAVAAAFLCAKGVTVRRVRNDSEQRCVRGSAKKADSIRRADASERGAGV